MLIVALVLAALAALVHVYIFVLESLLWTTPRARATFGTSAEQAAANKEMAFNQGFYNLFLAVLAGVGVTVAAAGDPTVGLTLVVAGTGSMAAAALVLLLTSPDKRGAALKQLAAPGLALIALAVAALLG